MDKPLWMWGTLIGIILCLLALDLGVFHRKQKEISIKDSLRMSAFYIVIACLFGGWIWHQLGAQSAKEYLTGFLVEKSLSLDNIFLISLIFSFFMIPLKYQHRVLFWGILGVIVLRAIMISLGATLVARFSWILYVFAVFLMATGIKMLFVPGKSFNINTNPLLKILRRYVYITPQLHGKKFFIKQLDPTTGKYRICWTPLFVTLIMIEFIDIIFAVDSVPAIFALTTYSNIVFTNSIFSTLGLQ
ncbi:MAG: TerC/Alx family metal homeostasis membrane protein, partial [Alphaproteobacteria bacterium]|nr:TerC/Alx family metal homeostasis membrane protein [Alphaproteobacteria bacterium]